MQGTLKGKKWIVGAGEHGYWLGSYEYQKCRVFTKAVPQGSVVYDIGANVGYFSLLAAILTGEKGYVYALEPLPRNVYFIHRHIELNKISNIEIIEAAVSDQEGQAAFNLGASSAMGHLSEEGEIEVNNVSLDQLLAEGKLLPPQIMKVDVEGAEHQVMQGAHQLLMDYQPTIFLDTHGRDAHQATIGYLQDLGYTFTILDGKTLADTKELIAHPAGQR